MATFITEACVIVRGRRTCQCLCVFLGVLLTRLGVAEHRWAAAEGGTAAIVTTAATTAAQAAPPHCRHQLDLFSGAH